MPQPPDDNSTSWVEDLEPEPPQRTGPGQWRELILGLAILFAVLGWAGWQWWSQAHNESEYSLGEQAQALNHLEEAEAHFANVADYKDAGRRAQELAGKISERDQQYRQATTANKAQDWLAAYAAARQVNDIQPGYKDSQSIFEQARQHIYTEALSGTIISRVDASPPGLYYRDGDRWVWLQGSDVASQVRGIGPPGYVVYDMPGANQTRSAADLNRLEGSRLMLAVLEPGGTNTFQPLGMDPARFDFFIWGEHGLWGLKSLIGDQNRPFYKTRPSYAGYSISYEKYGSMDIAEMLPTGTNWFIMDFAPDGEHVLLANIGDYSSNNPVTQLYMANGDGTDLHFLFTCIGGFYHALFSPDSKHVLAETYTHLGFNTVMEEENVILLDVTDATRQAVLAKANVQMEGTPYWHPEFSATFLQSGKYAGEILLAEWKADQTEVSIIDPRQEPFVVTPEIFDGDGRRTGDTWAGEIQAGDAPWVVFQHSDPGGNAQLIMVRGAGAFVITGPSSLYLSEYYPVTLQGNEKLQRAWIRDGRFIYLTATESENGALSDMMTLHQTSISELQMKAQLLRGDVTDPGLVYSNTNEQISTLMGSRSIVFGPGLLAFIDPKSGNLRQLAVESYDGAKSVTLDDGGVRMYDWSEYEVFRGLR